MLIPIHEEMTQEALGAYFSQQALEIIIAANLKQDALPGQIGHDEFHYDNNAIEKGNRYIVEQRGFVIASLLSPGVLSAWIAFGRLIHTAQDFYAHTNYVSLWFEQVGEEPTSPEHIAPLEASLLKSPMLHTGRIYFPIDLLYFVPFMRNIALTLAPPDSHARMNLDSARQGARFAYARSAAIKRTLHEYELLQKILTPEMFAKFTDL